MRALFLSLAVFVAFPVAAQKPPPCENCGRIDAIRTVTQPSQWTPLGTMGSVADPQNPGKVTTNYNFTTGNVVLLGAAGGAGYARRPQAYERPRWEVTVKMDTGDVRVLTQAYEPALREGDRVRVFGTQLELVD